MIELQNITFHYSGGTEAGGVREINLVIPDGQVILLCGQSGCGKTTLTRLINGLIPNYYEGKLTGNIFLDGKNINTLPLYETAKLVGSVFQNPRTQFFNVDSTSELAFECENQGLPENEIIGKNIFCLSGGEKQKIACASISVSNPPIIVLDEPSSNLDVSATADLRRLIKLWKSQGKTIIIAEHRLYYLKGLLDRVLYLKDGRIFKDFSASEALEFSAEAQIKLGLRPFDLTKFPYEVKTYTDKGKIGCSGFVFSYNKEHRVLNIPSLTFPQQSVIALIGYNGAGKSTFARCLCGLEQRCKGIVTINGNNYNRKQRLSHCYMVMQDVNHQLFTESTQEEMLISMAKPDEVKADTVLSRLDLLEFKECHPMALSGGQKQRVAIASALVSDREILVFDEPSSGLDLQHMREVAQELSALSQMGKTVLVITHDYELIVSCCTHILHLVDGEIHEQYVLDDAGMGRLKNFFVKGR